MKLHIDTTKPSHIELRLGEKKWAKTYNRPQEQNLLLEIDHFLKQEKINLKDLTGIEVNPGPGTFTGTRVGVALANALAFALEIPVNGQIPPVRPKYDQPPNITKPNRK